MEYSVIGIGVGHCVRSIVGKMDGCCDGREGGERQGRRIPRTVAE